MASRQRSRPPRRRKSRQQEDSGPQTQRRDPRRPEPQRREPHDHLDMRILLIKDVPRNYQWQDVKDEVKLYAPHLTVNDIDVLGSRLWSVDIRDSQKALEAYVGLMREGFRGGVQIGLKLLHRDGERVIAPLVYSPRPPPRAAPTFAVQPFVPYSAMHNIPPAPIPYPTANRHIAPPASMNNIMMSMQGLDIRAAPPARPAYQIPSADPIPARHRPAESVDQSSPPAPRSTRVRDTRADPLVCNGTVNRPSV